MAVKHVAICVAQVPFVRGGAEILVEGLAAALVERDIQAEIVKLPFKWYPKANLLRNCLAWRMLDLTESNGVPIDAVICTNFPSYVVAHPRKVIWLVHQHRHVYELYGSPFSDFSNSPDDQEILTAIQTLDRNVIGETQLRYAISANVAQRLDKFNGLSSQVIHPPPRQVEAYYCAEPGDYILSIGRLDAMKRVDLLLKALAASTSKIRAIIAGKGPMEKQLRAEVGRLGLEDRVELLGWVADDRAIELYAGARAVYFAPFDEDYGYVTVEALLSGKPVLTTHDSGGSLEFIRDGENGIVCRADPAELAAALDRLANEPTWAAQMGQAGRRAVEHISWTRTIETLLGNV